jgi:hypothetical protein
MYLEDTSTSERGKDFRGNRTHDFQWFGIAPIGVHDQLLQNFWVKQILLLGQYGVGASKKVQMLLKTKSKSKATASAETRRGRGFLSWVGVTHSVLVIAGLVLATTTLCAQAGTKRLILKDGSFQVATKWEIKGDRVRYYSAERYDWEELPSALVDWKATEEWSKEHAAAVSDQAAAQIAADKAEEEEASPTIAPGIRLPENGGLFLLDTYNSRAGLVELVQNGAQINKQMGKNILRSVINPLPTGPKQTMELKGAKARVQAHQTLPTIYANINYDDDAATAGEEAVKVNKEDRFKIVRVKQDKSGKRVVADLKINLLGGAKEQRNLVPTNVEQISTDWVKITPVKPLEPGEYALVEMLTPKQMNMYVWDFGVDPNAPPNPTAWKPAAPKPMPTATDESPVLSSRPKR